MRVLIIGGGRHYIDQGRDLEKIGLDVFYYSLDNISGILGYCKTIFPVRVTILKNKIDIVHAHYLYSGWVARLASLKPVVVTIMGSDFESKPREDGSYKIISKILHRLFTNLLAFVVPHTIVMNKHMSKKLFSRKKSVLPYGIDVDIFKPTRIERHNDKIKKILFAGQKNNVIKNYPLAENACNLLEIKYNVKLLLLPGNLSKKEINNLYNRVECILLTSFHEGAPMVIREALACKLPIVTVAVGDVNSLLSDINNCFIVDSDSYSISKALGKVLSNNKLSNPDQILLKKLCSKNVALRLYSIYNSVVECR